MGFSYVEIRLSFRNDKQKISIYINLDSHSSVTVARNSISKIVCVMAL